MPEPAGPTRHFQHDTALVHVTRLHDAAPCEGLSGSFDSPVLGVHLDRRSRVTQRREGPTTTTFFSPGELTLIPAELPLTCWTDGPTSFLHVRLADPLFGEPGAGALHERLRFDDPVCRVLALSIAESAQTEGAVAQAYIESAAGTLALRLLSLQGAAPIRLPPGGLSEPAHRRVVEFMQAQLEHNPGVAEMAEVAGLSVHHFSRLFTRTTGLPPHQYLQRLRAERAAALLREGRLNVLQVALAVGFANPSHFASFFRRATGVSPQAYRRAHR